MANRREKEAKSGQMKADGRGIERSSGPSEVHFQKILPVERVHANLPFSEVPNREK
jgi:hypothetical protein